MDYRVGYFENSFYEFILNSKAETFDLNFLPFAISQEKANTEVQKNTFDVITFDVSLYPKIKEEYAFVKTAVFFCFQNF